MWLSFLQPQRNAPFASFYPEPHSMPHTSGSSPVRILSCRLHRSDLTKTARPLESSCSALPQALQLVGHSTDGSIPFPSERQCSKPPTGLQEKKPYLAPPSVSSIELMRLSANCSTFSC